jgi:carbon monoxide dehydrogenase subunit G
MASIHKEITIDAPADEVWDVVRDIGAVHLRFVPGLVTDTRIDRDARIVTFANGFMVTEFIIDLDDASRRLSYTAVGGRLTHHNASMQVFEDGEHRSRLVWITDLLPNDALPEIKQLIDQGAEIIKNHLSRAASVSS